MRFQPFGPLSTAHGPEPVVLEPLQTCVLRLRRPFRKYGISTTTTGAVPGGYRMRGLELAAGDDRQVLVGPYRPCESARRHPGRGRFTEQLVEALRRTGRPALPAGPAADSGWRGVPKSRPGHPGASRVRA